MRESWSSLQTQVQDYTQDDSATTLAAHKRELNRAVRFVRAELRDHLTLRNQTFSTVDEQQYYHFPPDLSEIEMVKIEVGGITYPLEPIHSDQRWAELNAIAYAAFTIPTYFFRRESDFGIWPIPQDEYTGTLIYHHQEVDMANDDYTDETVTVTNNDETVTGSSTVFTAGMVGRWFKADDDGNWYRIDSFTSTTSIELESVFEGTTAAGASYTIGESPDLPVEAHELIACKAAEMFFAGKRTSPMKASFWGNMFWTGDGNNSSRSKRTVNGGLIGLKKRYSRRAATRVVQRRPRRHYINNRVWTYTLE